MTGDASVLGGSERIHHGNDEPGLADGPYAVRLRFRTRSLPGQWPLTKSNVVAKELKLIGEGSLAQVLDNARRELGEATDPSSGRPQWGDPEEEWSDRHELTEKR